MHNIDRTQAETTWETEEFETNGFEFEGDSEGYGEMVMEGLMSEADEMELAAQLLEVSDEAELDQFLGGLFKKVGKAVGGIVKSPIGRALGGALKGVAKRALPIAGGALGSYIPGVGSALGSRLASSAGQMFGLELEGMSAEDQEFEVARRFVRLAADATQNAIAAPPSAAPQSVAQQAVAAAAQKHAPGLVAGRQTAAAGANGRRQARSGRWIRRGNAIVILNA